MGADGKSNGVMTRELAMSVLANATVTLCSPGGLTKEDCAQVLASAARFIGVSTGSALMTSPTSLKQLISDLENQIIPFPGGNMPSYAGSFGENSFSLFINGIGPGQVPYGFVREKNDDCYRGYIEDGKAYLYDNSVILNELGISNAKGKDLSLQEIMEFNPEAAKYMSWWREKDKSYVMTLNTNMKDMPVSVIRRNHDVDININAKFIDENNQVLTEGKRLENAIAGMKKWEWTFYDTVGQKGFLWDKENILYDDFGYNEIEGQPGYVNVMVNIKQNANDNFLEVKLSNNSSKPTYSCRHDGSFNPHAILPFSSSNLHIQAYDIDIRSNHKYSDKDYIRMIGHETGHILGIDDGYRDETRGRFEEPPDTVEIPNNNGLAAILDILVNDVNNMTDIMINGNKVTSNDIEMILTAWKYQQAQGFGFYDDSYSNKYIVSHHRKSRAIRSY